MRSLTRKLILVTLLSPLFAVSSFAQTDNQANASALLDKAQSRLAVAVAAAQKDPSEMPVETFEDYGVEDFGGDMGSMDFGGDW